MSRPPNPHSAHSTGQDQTGDLHRLDYLPMEYADFLALQEELAVIRLGRQPSQADSDGEEADVAKTFMELSAVVAHVLSVYQRQHAAEAFLSTARAPESLVRHAHRLAYDPDPGLAASGHAVLFAKDSVGGTIAAGLALASVPLGETATQDYETRDDVVVDAALNELVPLGTQRVVAIKPQTQALRVQGVGHGLRTGDRVALVGPHWRGFIVEQAIEDPATDTTTVSLDRPVAATIDVPAAGGSLMLLAHPTRTLRAFGADADPALFPPLAVQAANATKPTAFPRYWYVVQRAGAEPSADGYRDADVYLSEQAPERLAAGFLLRCTGAALAVFKVGAETVAAVTLNREEQQSFVTHDVTITPINEGGFTSTVKPNPQPVTQVVASRISATVSAIQVADRAGTVAKRSAHPVTSEWLAGWAVAVPLADTEPNPAPVGGAPDDEPESAGETPLELPGLLAALAPGRPLVFTDREGTAAQVVTVRRVVLDAEQAVTRIWWDPVTPPPAQGWHFDDFMILGNVARVSHGRTVQETLGGSDGVTAFQHFGLRESPVTVLPGAAGGVPELEVRVDDVRWDRVPDFADSGPDDRHYRSVTDAALVTSIVFGDGRNGAVPPSGTKNITAVYRVGLGRAGDVPPRRLTRLKRAHPLLDRVVNVTPISGGAEPAGAEAIRSQSARWIRTFDRAVSVSDLADLALTMPGIARAAARWDQTLGAVLVVATAAGETPADLDAVRAFLAPRRDTAVPLTLCGPQQREVFVDVDVDVDPAHLIEVVKDGVRRALHGDQEDAPGMFTFPARELGQPAQLSEVYQRLEAVAGVIGVRVRRFGSRDVSGLADVIPAGIDEWLGLAPSHLDVTAAWPRSSP